MSVTNFRLFELRRTWKAQRDVLNDQLTRLLDDAASIPVQWGPSTASKLDEIIAHYDELLTETAKFN